MIALAYLGLTIGTLSVVTLAASHRDMYEGREARRALLITSVLGAALLVFGVVLA